jgi:hypothetical protein
VKAWKLGFGMIRRRDFLGKVCYYVALKEVLVGVAVLIVEDLYFEKQEFAEEVAVA